MRKTTLEQIDELRKALFDLRDEIIKSFRLEKIVKWLSKKI